MGYPLAARLLARLRPRRVQVEADALPAVCVIVAAHNEESVIERRIANLRALDYRYEAQTATVRPRRDGASTP